MAVAARLHQCPGCYNRGVPLGPWQPLELTYWSLATALAVGLAAWGYFQARSARWPTRILSMLGFGWFGFAGIQAAGFHLGPQSSQWFALMFAAFMPFVIAGLFEMRAARRAKH
jgi:hypothetical protein